MAEMNLDIERVEITTAFLNDDLKEEVCRCQPKVFNNKHIRNQICLLKNTVYILK